MKKHSTLERKMLSYFGLIAAASLLISIEFLWAIRVITPQLEVLDQSPSYSLESLQMVTIGLESLQKKALMMFAVQVVVTLIVLVMFMRKITGPLQRMVEETSMIADGDLSRSIRVDRKDEIGLLAETINSLTSNLQEIVALGLSTQSDVQAIVDELQSSAGDHICRPRLNELQDRLSGFREILDCFKLFRTPLEQIRTGRTK